MFQSLFQMNTLDTTTDQRRLNTNSLGAADAESITFVHGIGGSLSNWVFHYSIFLMQSYKCIAYDLRGHGNSFYPKKGYRLMDHTEDLESIQVENSSKNKKIVAHSYGGNIALKWAMKYGTKDDILIILDTPDLPVPSDTIHSFVHDIQAVLNKDFTPTSKFAVQLTESILEKKSKINRPAQNYKKRLSQLSGTNFENEIVLDQPFTEKELLKIAAKVVLIYAQKDDNIPYASRLMAAIPTCQLFTLDADHQLVTTHSKEIVDFIKIVFK